MISMRGVARAAGFTFRSHPGALRASASLSSRGPQSSPSSQLSSTSSVSLSIHQTPTHYVTRHRSLPYNSAIREFTPRRSASLAADTRHARALLGTPSSNNIKLLPSFSHRSPSVPTSLSLLPSAAGH